jgi:hypothetical protein
MSPTTASDRVPLALFFLRLSVFLVMLMWTIDKFVRPDHAAGVFENFYGLRGLGFTIMYVLAAAELVLLIGFVLGFARRFTYGLVFLLHGVSTLSSFRQYFNPFEGPHLLFFAAWPMLAACFALYYLRDLDTRWRV